MIKDLQYLPIAGLFPVVFLCLPFEFLSILGVFFVVVEEMCVLDILFFN